MITTSYNIYFHVLKLNWGFYNSTIIQWQVQGRSSLQWLQQPEMNLFLLVIYRTLCSKNRTSFHLLLTTTAANLSIFHWTWILIHYYISSSAFWNSLLCALLHLLTFPGGIDFDIIKRRLSPYYKSVVLPIAFEWSQSSAYEHCVTINHFR